jgi:hypothetical protein
MHLMELLGDVGQVESHFSPSRDGVGTRWCTVYAKCTIGSEIILDAHDGTSR